VPWLLRAEHGRDRARVPHDEVVWPRPHDVTVALEEVLVHEMLVPVCGDAGRPQSRHARQHGAGVLCEWVKWREAVRGDAQAQCREVEGE
jgi:hypothetical protein